MCKNKRLFLLQGTLSDEEMEVEELEEKVGEEEAIETPEISVHTLTSATHPDTIRVLGKIAGRSLSVFVNPDSTHNFISKQLVHSAKLPVNTQKKLRVMVASGDHIPCEGICSKMSQQIEGFAVLQTCMWCNWGTVI